MKTKARLGFLSLLLGLVTVQPALAGTDLEEGAKLYQAKDYTKAKPYFERAIKTNPSAWQAHYYLANTYLALGQLALAKHEYDQTTNMCTNPDILAQCKAGIERATVHAKARLPAATPAAATDQAPKTTPASKSQAASKAPEEDDDDDELGEKKEAPMTPSQLAAARRRDEIMKEAKEAVARVRKEAKDQLEQESANANQFWRYEDGHVGTDISTERKAEIEHEAEAKCRKIMEDAERRTRH